jgi:hypothetical protein
MGTIPVGQAVLQEIVIKLGSVYEAAAQLGVAPSLVTTYLAGGAPVPNAVLRRAVGMVLEERPLTPPAE